MVRRVVQITIFAELPMALAPHLTIYSVLFTIASLPSLFTGLHFFAALFCLITVVGMFLLFFFFTRLDSCLENKIFIGVNSGLCVIICIISMLPCTKKCMYPMWPWTWLNCCSVTLKFIHFAVNQNACLFQASIISVYVVYLTWTAMNSEPPPKVEIGRLTTDIFIPLFTWIRHCIAHPCSSRAIQFSSDFGAEGICPLSTWTRDIWKSNDIVLCWCPDHVGNGCVL